MTDSEKRIACPSCGARFKASPASVPEGGVGLRARCRQCQVKFRVTNAGGTLRVSIVEDSTLGMTTGSQELPPGAFEAGDRVGRYEVESILGRGGMGTVYQAHDPAANRPVALKVLSQDAADLDRLRFQREIEVQGNVQHPNIMPILDSGRVGSRRFYVMELLKDPLDLTFVIARAHSGSLTRDPKLRPLARIEGLVERVFLPLCEALYHANVNEGVLHRDVKPANILLDRAGLRPMLIDFGVSTLLDKSNARLAHLARELPIPLKGDGIRVTGTLVFMPPEQARGEADRRGDVWALGALLHYALTGAPPLEPALRPVVSKKERIQGLELLIEMARADERHDEVGILLRKISEIRSGRERTVEDLQQDVLDARYAERPPGVSRELVAILDRAMAKRPADRYRHAMELHADLAAWLGSRPVKARVKTSGTAGGLLYRARLFVRRQWIPVAAVLLIAILGALLLMQTPDEGPDQRVQAEARLVLALEQATLGNHDQAHALARETIGLDPGNDAAFALIERLRVAEQFAAMLARARDLRAQAAGAFAAEDLPAARGALAALHEVVSKQIRPHVPSDLPPVVAEEIDALARFAADEQPLTIAGAPAGAELALLPVDALGNIAWTQAEPVRADDPVVHGGAWILRVRAGKGVVHIPFQAQYGGDGARVRCPVDPGTLGLREVYVGPGRVRGPLGEVEVRRALIWDAVEVSCARYARFLDSLPAAERARRVPRTVGPLGAPIRPLWEVAGDGFKPPAGADLRPVESISLHDARAFARFEKKRLPTAGEWAWAATGPDGRVCPVGPAAKLWAGQIRLDRPKQGPDDSRSVPLDRSPFGLYDMAGNLSELTSSLATLDGLSGWVVMGGGYLGDASRAIVTNGVTVPGWLPLEGVGFRCVRTAE